MDNIFLKEYDNIEKDFFDIDDEEGIAKTSFTFDTPSDIFDNNYKSKTPVLSDDFMDWLNSAFTLVPIKYKIKLEVAFKNSEGYTQEDMTTIFWKNIVLDFKTSVNNERKKIKIANSLIVIGVLAFITVLLIENLWKGNSLLRQIFAFMADIATTVIFWEAFTLLVVYRQVDNSKKRSIHKRFCDIVFNFKNEI